MAYNVPDADGYTYKPRSAQANAWVAGYEKEDALHREDLARAEEAGVTSADKIDYAEALRNYESRPDAELFANRRAREYADAFEDQDFARVTIDIAGPVQSSTIGTTSVADGDQDLTDANNDEPYQPVKSTGHSDSFGEGTADAPAAPPAPVTNTRNTSRDSE